MKNYAAFKACIARAQQKTDYFTSAPPEVTLSVDS